MPGGKDIPDWGGTYTNTFFQPLFDHGELAVRLGSPITHDRRGAVVWVDTFEGGLSQWQETTSGAGSGASLDAGLTMHGNFSAKLVTGAVVSGQDTLYRGLPVPGAARLGFGAFYNPLSDNFRFTLRVIHVTTAARHTVTLVVEAGSLNNLLLGVEEGTIELDDSFSVSNELGVFNFVKVVIDLDDFSVPRVLINDVEYDTSQYHMVLGGSLARERIQVEMDLLNLGSAAQTMYIDTFIMTAVEP